MKPLKRSIPTTVPDEDALWGFVVLFVVGLIFMFSWAAGA